MIFKLTQGATISQIEAAGYGGRYAIWDSGIFPSDSNGVPFTTAYINVMGDPVADLHEDMAAEQKARATYENLIKLTDDVDLQQAVSRSTILPAGRHRTETSQGHNSTSTVGSSEISGLEPAGLSHRDGSQAIMLTETPFSASARCLPRSWLQPTHSEQHCRVRLPPEASSVDVPGAWREQHKKFRFIYDFLLVLLLPDA